jgi:hypothetical protein
MSVERTNITVAELRATLKSHRGKIYLHTGFGCIATSKTNILETINITQQYNASLFDKGRFSLTRIGDVHSSLYIVFNKEA